MRLGFFDSGVGGLAIARAVQEVLPEYDYSFYGDTANVPYGDKTEEEILALTQAGVERLFLQDCAIVILACNTASAETLRTLQDTYLPRHYPDRRILGVIIPTIEEVIMRGSRRALLIATSRTVASTKYERELSTRNSTDLALISQATPSLVPLIEANKFASATREAISIIDRHRRAVHAVDTVVLGCTHYTVLKGFLREHYGEVVSIVSQDEVIPRKLADYLMRHPEIEKRLTRRGMRDEYFTGKVDADLLAWLAAREGSGA